MKKSLKALSTKKTLTFIGSAIFLLLANSCEQAPQISACQCLDNMNSGWYDDLNPEQQKVRKYCLDKYAGEANMLLDCQKERKEK